MNDFFERFLDYNERANQLYIDAIAKGQPKNERIATVFCHILNANRIWLDRVEGKPMTGGVWDMHAVEEWAAINAELARRNRAVAGPESLARVLDYKDLRSESHRRTIQDILTHVINHSTYHRGQIAILFGQEQLEPPVTDFARLAPEAEM